MRNRLEWGRLVGVQKCVFGHESETHWRVLATDWTCLLRWVAVEHGGERLTVSTVCMSWHLLYSAMWILKRLCSPTGLWGNESLLFASTAETCVHQPSSICSFNCSLRMDNWAASQNWYVMLGSGETMQEGQWRSRRVNDWTADLLTLMWLQRQGLLTG